MYHQETAVLCSCHLLKPDKLILIIVPLIVLQLSLCINNVQYFHLCVTLVMRVSVISVGFIVHLFFLCVCIYLISIFTQELSHIAAQLCLSWPSAGVFQTWESLSSSHGCCSICECVFLVTLNCSSPLCRLTLANSCLHLQLWQEKKNTH